MKPTALVIPNSFNVKDTETIHEPMLVVIDMDTKEVLWAVELIAKTFRDLELMEELNIVYTSDLEPGEKEWRNGILLYGTTYERVIWADEVVKKEKTRSAATERAI